MKNKILFATYTIAIIAITAFSSRYVVNKGINDRYNLSYNSSKQVADSIVENKLDNAYNSLSNDYKANQTLDSFQTKVKDSGFIGNSNKYYIQYMGQNSNSIVAFTITDKSGAVIGTIYTETAKQDSGKWAVDDVQLIKQ